MSLLVLGAMAVGVAQLANSNEDSPVLWGFITFAFGLVGNSVFGFLGACIGAGVAACIYVGKMLKYG